jgi:hypothetical protein
MKKVSRKTIEVGKVLNMANYFLNAENTTPDERIAVAQFLESILFETGNYEGYRYTESLEVDGMGTRRQYFPSSKIREDAEADLRNVNKIRV